MPEPIRSTRIFLVCHGSTEATRRTRFPLDEPIEPTAVAAALRLSASGRMPERALTLCGPALRCRQTAAALGLAATVHPGLTDWDLGSWAGASLDEVTARAPGDVHAWICDPDAAPHGGESLNRLVARVGAWLDRDEPERTGRYVAVTHPAVVRAAVVSVLGSTAAFWRIDVSPLTVVELRGRPGHRSLHL